MPIKTETFVCEFCGEQFDTEQECLDHQAVVHNRDYSDASNKEIAKALEELAESGWGYRIGSSVLGLPYREFVSILKTAATRLERSVR